MEGTTTKLDVSTVLLSAIVAPIVHWKLVLWFAIPLVVIDWTSLLFRQLVVNPSVGEFLGNITLAIASGAAWLLLAVACHRIFILGEESMAGRMFVRWTPRETRFLGWAISLGLVATVLFIPMVVFAPLLAPMGPVQIAAASFILFLPVLYISTRLSLVLPATATDRTPDLAWAWKASKNSGMRLMLAVSLLPLLIQLALLAFQNNQSFVYRAALSLIEIFAVVVGIAALSISYRELGQDCPAPDRVQ